MTEICVSKGKRGEREGGGRGEGEREREEKEKKEKVKIMYTHTHTHARYCVQHVSTFVPCPSSGVLRFFPFYRQMSICNMRLSHR